MMWRHFVHGATRPSVAALWGTLAVLLFWAACAVCFVRPSVLGGLDPGYFARTDTDDFGRLTGTLFGLHSRPAPPLSLTLIGASATQESVDDERRLASALSAEVGAEVEVFNLTAGALTLWEMIGALDVLPTGSRGVVVLGIAPLTMATGTDRLKELLEAPRLGLDGESLLDEIRRAGLTEPRRTGIWVYDHAQFFLSHVSCFARVFRGPAASLRHRYTGHRAATDVQQGAHDERLRDAMQVYFENADENFARLERLISRVRVPGRLEVVLLLAPINPSRSAGLYDARATSDFKVRLEGLSQKLGVELWALDEEAALGAGDFFDSVHLSSADAQRRYTDRLIARLGAPLRSTSAETFRR